jgi:DNA polymerase-3 subunit gamma/tau
LLSLDYRPQKFSELVGQQHVRVVLQAMLTKGQIPASMIFAGTRGSGKTSTARILAAALNCPNGTADACTECSSCIDIESGASMAVIEVDAASTGGVDDVRNIREMCGVVTESPYRVVILDEAQSMSRPAFNALLKLLEEPPADTLFLLLTTEPDKILGTVRSRCMIFEFRPLPTQAIVQRLQHICQAQGVEMEADVLEAIAVRADGGLRDAVMLLDQASQVGIKNLKQLNAVFGYSTAAEDIMAAALQGALGDVFKVSDLYFSKSGDVTGLVTDLSIQVKNLLVEHPSPALIKAMELLWEARTIKTGTRDARAQANVMLSLLTAALGQAKPILMSTSSAS